MKRSLGSLGSAMSWFFNMDKQIKKILTYKPRTLKVIMIYSEVCDAKEK